MGINTNPFTSLSNREMEVALQLLSGMELQKIAHTMNLQLSTVSTFKKRVYDKLNVSNIFELQKLSETYGLIKS
jgi:DNA-binding NarL/FixJ family response regulator